MCEEMSGSLHVSVAGWGLVDVWVGNDEEDLGHMSVLEALKIDCRGG